MARRQILAYQIAERVVQAVANPSGWATAYAVTVSSATPAAGATVTVSAQLVDASNTPIAQSGRTVTWSTTAGSLSVQTSNTNTSGVATVVLTTSTVAGTTHVVTGVDNSDVTGISPTVTSQVGAGSLTTSTVEVADSSLPADGSSTTTVTVTLYDAYNNALTASGGTVVIATTAGTVGATTDNDDGTYTATLTAGSTADVTATLSATLGGNALNDTASCLFGSFVAPDILNLDLAGAYIDASDIFRHANGTAFSPSVANLWGNHQHTILDDPNGAGMGRVVRCHYQQGALDSAFGIVSPANLAFGEEFYAAGNFYFESAAWTLAGGKLEQLQAAAGIQWVLYFQPQDATHAFLGTQIVTNVPYGTFDGNGRQSGTKAFSPNFLVEANRVYHYERRLKANTGYGVTDGEAQVWFDGVSVLNESGIDWFRSNNGNPFPRNFSFGKQVNKDSGTFSAYICWSDVKISTQRIGPG